MENSDAIKMLERMQEPGGHVTEYKTHFDALQMAIAALKRRTPKKPIEFDNDIEKIMYFCPNCGLIFDKPKELPSWLHNTLYCERCGQAIDWSGLL